KQELGDRYRLANSEPSRRHPPCHRRSMRPATPGNKPWTSSTTPALPPTRAGAPATPSQMNSALGAGWMRRKGYPPAHSLVGGEVDDIGFLVTIHVRELEPCGGDMAVYAGPLACGGEPYIPAIGARTK